ncbi:MAG: hypothetical protein AB7F66_16590, partial [Bacteriovoracia bacterium]
MKPPIQSVKVKYLALASLCLTVNALADVKETPLAVPNGVVRATWSSECKGDITQTQVVSIYDTVEELPEGAILRSGAIRFTGKSAQDLFAKMSPVPSLPPIMNKSGPVTRKSGQMECTWSRP